MVVEMVPEKGGIGSIFDPPGGNISVVYKWYILPIWIWNHASLDLMILSTSFFVKASDLSSAVKPTSTGVISNNVTPYFFQWSSTGMVLKGNR